MNSPSNSNNRIEGEGGGIEAEGKKADIHDETRYRRIQSDEIRTLIVSVFQNAIMI